VTGNPSVLPTRENVEPLLARSRVNCPLMATYQTPRQLLLSAFSTVQDQLRWDHRGQRWIKA
jgi:hypothetical protein